MLAGIVPVCSQSLLLRIILIECTVKAIGLGDEKNARFRLETRLAAGEQRRLVVTSLSPQ